MVFWKMRYQVLICDYDGTLAQGSSVAESTIASLEDILSSGRKLLMATGRQLEELLAIFPRSDLFERIIVENGAVLYAPRTQRTQMLAEPPPQKVFKEFVGRGISPIATGKVIISTRQPHEAAAVEIIRDLGLDLQVVFNKGAVMILPQGVNKATGILAALRELGISIHNAIGIGDAENDHSFLSRCECSAAVANALEAVRERVDVTMTRHHGRGVEELIGKLLATDLVEIDGRLARHHLLLGTTGSGAEVRISPFGSSVLIAGPSGSGKSSVVTAVLERLARSDYQFCVIDPEGDYQMLQHAVVVGDAKSVPSIDGIIQLLSQFSNPVVNLLGVPLSDRPAFGELLLEKIVELQSRTGHPHWIVLDEAHHLLPASFRRGAPPSLGMSSSILITVHPNQVRPEVLAGINLAIAVGASPDQTLIEFSKQASLPKPTLSGKDLGGTRVHVWRCRDSTDAFAVRVEPSEIEGRRHKRKYAEGDIKEKSFHFRGPKEKLNLRAQNLITFVQLAEGVDDETWLFHLRRSEYSHWIKSAIKDDDLARRVAAVERANIPASESRAQIKEAIEDLYTDSSQHNATA